MSAHDFANYQIIKLTNKLTEQGWTNQELEDFTGFARRCILWK